jgi:cell division protein FtsB
MNKEKGIKNSFKNLKNNSSAKSIVYVIVLLSLFFIIVTQSLTIIRLRYDIADNEELVNDYKNNNKILQEKIETMTTYKYIEEQAREKLGMVKTNETPVIVMKEKEDTKKIKTLDSQEKIGIYMKDYYEQLEEWVKDIKK